MNKNFILKTGKFAGKTIGWIEENNPWYLIWIEENKPFMLKGSMDEEPVVAKKMTKTEKKSEAMQPNMGFWDEGPSELTKIYLETLKQKNA